MHCPVRAPLKGMSFLVTDRWSPSLQWSLEVIVRTRAVECPDAELRQRMRLALNSSSYADKVASQLHLEQWSIPLLEGTEPDELMAILRRIKVKEGAVHAILASFQKLS